LRSNEQEGQQVDRSARAGDGRTPEGDIPQRDLEGLDAELAIFAWIEGWYNPERIIAVLGMRSPNEYEAAFYAETTNANLDTTVKVGNPESSLQ